jgi:hypothetical protein
VSGDECWCIVRCARTQAERERAVENLRSGNPALAVVAQMALSGPHTTTGVSAGNEE